MSKRARQLHTSADDQISTLIELLSDADDATMRRPCPGREKLGDGTIGANAAHTAGNYRRIATFVATSEGGSHGHEDGFTAEGVDPTEIVERLTSVRAELGRIAQLSDHQLDSVPPKNAFRFCDGERTFEQVLSGLLKHQGNQVQALGAALNGTV